jgi:hypothetical protein
MNRVGSAAAFIIFVRKSEHEGLLLRAVQDS